MQQQQQQQQEAELFHDYELTGWELSPRIYKILGAAAAIHLFAFIVFAQVDLLGTKACDSPYVGKVCQVLDAAYVGSILLGTDTEFASRDYDKTEIDEADVTFIDVSEEFKYPEGYFAVSNPTPTTMTGYEQMMTGDGMTITSSSIPGIPPGFGNTTPMTTLDPNQPAILPTPNPNAVQGTIPDSPLGNIGGGNPTINPPRGRIRSYPIPKQRKIPNNSPTKLPDLTATADKNANKTPNDNTTAKTDDKKPKTEGQIDESKGFNPKPLEDWATTNGEKILNKEVDVNAPFVIEIVAQLDENGKFVKPKMTSTTDSDPKMTELAKQAILAFGDSQLLKPLYDVGGRNVKITFAQNQDNLQAIIMSETRSENEAKTLQSGLNIYLKNFFKPKEGSDEQILMSKAKLDAQGKNLIINFLIPNDEKTQMIEKNLRSLQEKLKNKQPNSGVAETINKDVNSAK